MKIKDKIQEECLTNDAMQAYLDGEEYIEEVDNTFEDGWIACLQWLMSNDK